MNRWWPTIDRCLSDYTPTIAIVTSPTLHIDRLSVDILIESQSICRSTHRLIHRPTLDRHNGRYVDISADITIESQSIYRSIVGRCVDRYIDSVLPTLHMIRSSLNVIRLLHVVSKFGWVMENTKRSENEWNFQLFVSEKKCLSSISLKREIFPFSQEFPAWKGKYIHTKYLKSAFIFILVPN